MILIIKRSTRAIQPFPRLYTYLTSSWTAHLVDAGGGEEPDWRSFPAQYIPWPTHHQLCCIYYWMLIFLCWFLDWTSATSKTLFTMRNPKLLVTWWSISSSFNAGNIYTTSTTNSPPRRLPMLLLLLMPQIPQQPLKKPSIIIITYSLRNQLSMLNCFRSPVCLSRCPIN